MGSVPASQADDDVADVVVDVDGAPNAGPVHGGAMRRIKRVEVTNVKKA